MKVSDLQQRLAKADPDAEVVVPRWGLCEFKIATSGRRESFKRRPNGIVERELGEGMPKGNFFLIQ